jgi:hypothetical protein
MVRLGQHSVSELDGPALGARDGSVVGVLLWTVLHQVVLVALGYGRGQERLEKMPAILALNVWFVTLTKIPLLGWPPGSGEDSVAAEESAVLIHVDADFDDEPAAEMAARKPTSEDGVERELCTVDRQTLSSFADATRLAQPHSQARDEATGLQQDRQSAMHGPSAGGGPVAVHEAHRDPNKRWDHDARRGQPGFGQEGHERSRHRFSRNGLLDSVMSSQGPHHDEKVLDAQRTPVAAWQPPASEAQGPGEAAGAWPASSAYPSNAAHRPMARGLLPVDSVTSMHVAALAAVAARAQALRGSVGGREGGVRAGAASGHGSRAETADRHVGGGHLAETNSFAAGGGERSGGNHATGSSSSAADLPPQKGAEKLSGALHDGSGRDAGRTKSHAAAEMQASAVYTRAKWMCSALLLRSRLFCFCQVSYHEHVFLGHM